jgi:hypothetical protein
MLLVLVALAYLYISPVRGLISDLQVASSRHLQVLELERTSAQLHAQERTLQQASTLEVEARNLGLVRPGEREYVVSGLPDN